MKKPEKLKTKIKTPFPNYFDGWNDAITATGDYYEPIIAEMEKCLRLRQRDLGQFGSKLKGGDETQKN